MIQPDRPPFPVYSPGERAADRAVHVVGVAAALAGVAVLLPAVARAGGAAATAAVAVYCVGLVLMLGASAAYNLAPAGLAKERLRRLDHAAIYVMIAGSYTPFAANLVAWPWGPALCAAVWAVAVAGVTLKLAAPRRYERFGIALYLAQGWMLLPVLGPMADGLPARVLWLLVAGGVVYSLGTAVHLARRLPFHNALWHAMVLAAAALHFGAVAAAFTPWLS